MRVLIVLQYDGQTYYGWQRQPNIKATVQQTVEFALSKVLGEEVVLFASGRTDKGVHALGQTAHFDTNKIVVDSDSITRYKSSNDTIYTHKIVSGANHFLPLDIRIMKAYVVDGEFNARYSVVSKSYNYVMYSGAQCPLLNGRAYRLINNINVDKINHACGHLLGKHDFSSYMSSGSGVKTTVRNVFGAKMFVSNNKYNEGLLYEFEIKANGFLYNMVRIIVAHLIRIGKDEEDPINVKRALLVPNRYYSRFVAPAYGLYLKSVEYDRL